MNHDSSLPSSFSVGGPDQGIDFYRIYVHSENVIVVEVDKRKHPGGKRRMLRLERESADTSWPSIQVVKQVIRSIKDVPPLTARIEPNPEEPGGFRLKLVIRREGKDTVVCSPDQTEFFAFASDSQTVSRSWLATQRAEALRVCSADNPATAADLDKIIRRFAR